MSQRQGPRGQYRKGVERRREIVAAAATLFSEVGYARSSMRELARRLGLTQAGVLHHFSDKEELLVEVLNLRDAAVSEHLADLSDDDVPTRSREVARYSAANEGLTSLYIVLSAEATDPDHPAHDYFAQHYRSMRHEVAGAVSSPVPEQTRARTIDPELVACLERAVQDGLQLQRRYLPDLDTVAAVDAFWALVAAAQRASLFSPATRHPGNPSSGSDAAT